MVEWKYRKAERERKRECSGEMVEAGHDHVERGGRGGEPKGQRGESGMIESNERERGGASSTFYSGPGLWGGAYLAIAR